MVWVPLQLALGTSKISSLGINGCNFGVQRIFREFPEFRTKLDCIDLLCYSLYRNETQPRLITHNIPRYFLHCSKRINEMHYNNCLSELFCIKLINIIIIMCIIVSMLRRIQAAAARGELHVIAPGEGAQTSDHQ